MKHEIENLKNEKQVQLNLIKLKKEEIYEKNQTIEQYEKESSNHKLELKKQETLIKATTERGNKLQNELDQTKTEMTIQQKELSELIQNHQQLHRKYLESQDISSAKGANIHQVEGILKQNEHTIKTLQSNLELYRKKCTNYNDETELNERGSNDTSDNTKTNKNNIQTILEHNKHDYMKIDPKTNNDNQEQSTSKNTLKAETKTKQNNDKIKQIISVPTYLIGNIVGRNGHRIKSIQTQSNVVIQAKYCQDRNQSLCIEGKKENVNWAIEEILEIVTCVNYPKHQCTYGHQCKFLHYRITPQTLTNKEDISNPLNQSVDFKKSVIPQNNTSSNQNSKSQNMQSKLSSKNLPHNQQTSNAPQQITEILREVMKPETIKEILESLKIITTTIKSNYDSNNRNIIIHSKKVMRSKKRNNQTTKSRYCMQML